jgi:hypothetical protein
MAGIFGIALVAGVLESLSTPTKNEERKGKIASETKEKAG